MKKKLGGIIKNSLVNGPGMRYVIFSSGCSKMCPGCHNSELQSFNFGEEYSIDEIIEEIKSCTPIVKGVTFSGGDPMESAEFFAELAYRIKKELELNIWCYTGFTLEEIISIKNKHMLKLLSLIDTLVDGPFILELKEGASKYTGSNNQKIITFKK